MFKKLLATMLLAALWAAPSYAQTYVVNVHGIVCEFCAYGVGKKIRKLPFIDTEKLDKGVKVDIKNQQVLVAIKAGIPLDEKALFDAIESGGYKPIDVKRLTGSNNTVEVE